MDNPLSRFIEPDNIIHLATMRAADYPAYRLALSEWYQRVGYGSGITVNGLDDIIKEAGPGLIEERAIGGPEAQPWSEVLTLSPDEKIWVVDGLLYGGGLSLLSADPKCGKSTLARWLASCVLAGAPFLGRDCPKGRVLYYSLEDPAHVVAEDIQAFAKHLGLSWRDVEGSFFVFHKRATGDIIERMAATIKAHDISLVVVDTLIRFLGIQGEGDYGAVTQAMDRLKRPLTEPGSWASKRTHILTLHHNRKAGAGQGGDVYKASLGSTSLRGSTDVNLSMTVEKGGARKLHRTEGRVKRHLPAVHIVQREGYLDWAPVPEEGEARDNARLEATISYLAGGKGVTKGEVQQVLKDEGLGLASSKWSAYWNQLLEDGLISFEGGKMYGVMGGDSDG